MMPEPAVHDMSTEEEDGFVVPELRDFSTEEIRRICREAASSFPGCSGDERLERMRSRYPEFWYRYPKLLDMACQPGMDLTRLDFMLGMLSTVRNEGMGMETANQEVQKILADAYLPANLRAPGQQEVAKEEEAKA